MERTLIIVKPDAVQRGLIGEIVTRFERRGLKIVGLKLMQIDEPLARRHYAVHEGKSFFPGLIQYITSAPVAVMVSCCSNRASAQLTRRALSRVDDAILTSASSTGSKLKVTRLSTLKPPEKLSWATSSRGKLGSLAT